MDLRSLAVKASDEELDATLYDQLYIIASSCTYYHYQCDGVDDRGWGCGYRSVQSLCSWTEGQKRSSSSPRVPSLQGIQEYLVEAGDKPQAFIGSREWIGSFEACLVLDHIYGVSCRIIHVGSGADVIKHVPDVVKHFKDIASPVMIGGDIDASSKTLIGVATDGSANTHFLIADPHYIGATDEKAAFTGGYVKWHGLDLFSASSFYNFCLPQAV